MTLTAIAPREFSPMTSTSRTTTGSSCSCGARTGDGAYLCGKCTTQLADDLRLLGPATTEVPTNARWQRDYDAFGAQVRDADGKLVPVTYGRATSTRWDTPVGSRAGLVEHLELTASRQVRIGGAAGGEKPVPFNARAAEIRGRLDHQLRPWALWLAGELPPVAPPACTRNDHEPWRECPTCHALQQAAAALTEQRRTDAVRALTTAPVSDVVAFLGHHLEQIRHSPDAGQLAHAVSDAVKTITKVIDRPGEQRYGGPCGAELPSGALCDAKLYADEGDRDFVCPTCGAEWAVEERQAWLLKFAVDELATAPIIAAAFAREPADQDDAEPKEFRRLLNRIYQWSSRGRLTARGELRGQPLYRVGDVEELMQAHTERQSRTAEKRRTGAGASGS